VRTWIDEAELVIGDEIEHSIRRTIDANVDYVLLFVDEQAGRSRWVRAELQWALEHEESLGRPFVLPVVIDSSTWSDLLPPHLHQRRYLSCPDFSSVGIRHLAEELISELFSRLTRDLELARETRNTSKAVGLLNQADEYLGEVSQVIRMIAYPFRKENPLSLEQLFARFRAQGAFDTHSVEEFEALLARLRQRGLLAGVVSAGNDIYVEEEHYAWKTTMNVDLKRRIASEAFKRVRSEAVIIVDAGSTTLELIKLIGRALKMGSLSGLRIVTNSIPGANYLLSVANELGLEDSNSLMQLYIAGGRIRCNTLAVVNDDNLTESSGETDLASTIRTLGGRSAAFVGTNGISFERGFSTHDRSEFMTKQAMLNAAQDRYILTDPTKFDISEEFSFASFADGVTIITVAQDSDERVQFYEEGLKDTPSTVVVVR
jgi:DeoR family fructose operon transcriptional repressor